MNIALLSAEYPPAPGGVGDYTRQLGLALRHRGHDIIILTGGDRAGEETPPVFRLTLDHWNWRCWKQVARALETQKPDVLHIQYQTGAYDMHPAINFLPRRLRANRRRPRLVVTAHDLLPPYLFPKAGPLRDWVTRRLMLDTDATIATTDADADRLRQWGAERNQRPLRTIPIGANIAVAPPPGYDRHSWRASLGYTPDMTVIAYFGLISPTKGLDTLVGALELLPPTCRLLIIGGEATAPADQAYAAEVRRQIAETPLNQRVIFTGHCDEADVSAHLLAADLAALPFSDGASFRRGSLLAVLAHGVPTITTPGAATLVHDEQALLTPPGNARALANTIARLTRDPALRERIGAGGRSLARRFSWAEIAQQHEELYQSL